jgi:hypothetical protein
MGRRTQVIVWSAVFLAGVALLELGVYRLVQIGSCSSGGTYQIRVQCPHSIWLWIGLVALGAVVGFLGLALLSTEFSDAASGRLTSFAWSGGWIVTGIVSLVAVYMPGTHAGAKTGGIIICVVFVALGVFFLLLGRRKSGATEA